MTIRVATALAAAMFAAGGVGCTTIAVTHTETPLGAPRARLLLPEDPPVEGGWAFEGERTIVGRVDWSKNCQIEEYTTFQKKEVTTTKSDIAGNVGMLVTGMLLMGGGATLLGLIPSQGDNKCGEGSDGSSCGLVFGVTGGLGAATGLGMAIYGIVGLARGTDASERPEGVEEHKTRLVLNQRCGSTPPAGLELTLSAPGLIDIVVTTDAQGRARFELPPDADVAPDAIAEIVMHPAGPLADRVRDGSAAGSIALAPYAAAIAANRVKVLAARRAARDSAIRQADNQEFSGAVHGDALAKTRLTFDCHPDGRDICFDAIDNDCDGLYDVGCGYQSGALQWTLAWGTGDDLDLHIIGPDGAHVFFGHKKGGAAGLVLDVDCLGSFGNNCLAQNVENIFTPRDKKPMEGTYRGWVEVYNAVAGDSGRTIEAMLGGRLAGKTYRMPMTLQAQRHVRIFFAFAIGPDRDADSVIDREDACPDKPGVFSTFPAENGCPDSDLDGIADSVDQCPNEVGLRFPPPSGRKGWSIGCPKKYGKARLTDLGVEITEDILFPSGSAVIEPRSYGVLHDIADVIRDAPYRLPIIVVKGHTDSDGDALDNRKLSIKRAESVRDYLLKRERVPAKNRRGGERFWTQGLGADLPKVPNDTPAHKQLNRRVEFHVFDPAAATVRNW